MPTPGALVRIDGSPAPPPAHLVGLYRVAAAKFRRAMAISTAGMALRAAVRAVQGDSGVTDDEALQIVADAVSYAATHHADWFWRRG